MPSHDRFSVADRADELPNGSRVGSAALLSRALGAAIVFAVLLVLQPLGWLWLRREHRLIRVVQPSPRGQLGGDALPVARCGVSGGPGTRQPRG